MSSQQITRIRGASRLALIALVGSIAFRPVHSFGQAPVRPDRSTGEPTPIASTRSSPATSIASVPAPHLVSAVAKVIGTASPGLQVTLDGSASTGGRMWYRWIQTQGPKVEIDDATKVDAHFTVPTDASSLGFVLVVGNATGVDAKAIQLDIEDPERDAEKSALKADAGDEQSAKVGRRVVLNGSRSEPKGKIRFRWVQAGGPKVAIRANEGPTASFVPTMAGAYRFALIVAMSDGAMSEPSMVTITVGGTLRASVDAPMMSIDELARASISSIEGGPRYADDLSKAFDSVADGINTFKTFTEAITETTRRLDAVVPRDKERRAVWIEQLFSPLMNKVVVGMRVEGLDLSQPDAQAKPLTKDQRAHLAEQFRFTAAGLRASKTMK